MPPDSGPWCLEVNDTVTRAQAVCDTDGAMLTVRHYVRPDGSVVR